jgi:hypothetical protein
LGDSVSLWAAPGLKVGYIELWTSGPQARVTQVFAEVVASAVPQARITQTFVEVVVS